MHASAPEDRTPVLPVEPEAVGEPSSGEVTRLLVDWNKGDAAARDRLLSLVYGELRRMAHRRLSGEWAEQRMHTGTLIDEVYLKLFKANGVPCQNRKEFFSIAARLMRQVLVDAARKRNSQQRGGKEIHISLEETMVVTPALNLNLLALDEALKGLARHSTELSEVVELRYFADLTIEQTADILGVATDTVKRRWRRARTYLHQALTYEKEGSDGSTTLETD